MICNFCNLDQHWTFSRNGVTICNGCAKTAAYFIAMKFAGGPAGSFTGNIKTEFEKLLPKE